MDKVALESFYNHYHSKVVSKPNLYHNGNDIITLVLPVELLDYANSASGHSGHKTGARPVGIRVVVKDSTQSIKDIFSSIESLEQFILSSECDAMPVKTKVSKPLMANKEFWNRYDKTVMDNLKAKFKYDTLKLAFSTMTIDQFESEFNLI